MMWAPRSYVAEVATAAGPTTSSTMASRVAVVGVADADRPWRVGCGVPAHRDVAAGVDGEVGVAVGFEDAGCTFDRPALDDAGGVEGACRWARGRRRRRRRRRCRRRSCSQSSRTSATSSSTSSRVISPRPSREIGLSGMYGLNVWSTWWSQATASSRPPRRGGVADVERDRRAHHVLDVVAARRGRCGGGGHQTIAVSPAALAASIADWSDRR